MGIQRKNKWKRKNIQVKTERVKTKEKNKKNVRTKEKEKKIYILEKKMQNDKKRGFNVRKIK